MRIKTLLSLVVLVVLAAAPAQAQDPGMPDTLEMVLVHGPDANAGDTTLQIELWAYTDEYIFGAGIGFCWDNSNLQMDSGVVSPLVASGFDGSAFVYENNNINVTNANQHFLLGGFSMFDSIAPDPSGRRLWATYYFSLSSWMVNDSIVIDTLQFNPVTDYTLVAYGDLAFGPQFTGKLVIYDPNRPANLVVAPQVLNFSATAGGSDPTDQTFDIGSDGDPLDFTLSNDSVWLSTVPSSGNTDATITVSVDILGKVAGTYIDTITVTSATAGNSPQKVVVNLNIAAPPANLVVSPQVLNFSAVEGGSDPADQTFDIGSDGDPLDFTLSNDSAWLSTDPSSGTSDATITVSVSISGLTTGTYVDTIAVASAAAGNSPQYVEVNLDIAALPNLVVSPQVLNFSAVEGGSDPADQTFDIGSDGASLDFTLSNDSAWLSTVPSSGSTDATITVSVDISGKVAGTYIDTITVTSATAGNSPQKVAVNLDIAALPSLVVSPQVLNFSAVEGDPNPADQTFDIGSDGATLDFTLSNDSAWLSTVPSSGSTDATITVSVDISGKVAGIYIDTITVTSATAGNSPQKVVVNLNIASPQPNLVVTPQVLNFSAVEGDPNPADQTFDIGSDGASLDFTLSNDSAWLSTVPSSGSTDATITVSVDISGKVAGTYIDTITVTSATAGNSPQKVAVNLDIAAPPANLVVTPQVLNFSAVEGDPNPADQTFDIGSDGASLDFTLSNDSAWLSTVPSSGSTDATITVSVSISGLTAGTYVDTITVTSATAGNSPQKVLVSLDVTEVAPCEDMLTVATVPAVPGAQVVVPVDFTNCCDLSAIEVELGWYSPYIYLDAVSFADSRLTDFPVQYGIVNNSTMTVLLGASNDGLVADVPPGDGNFVNLHFSVAVEAPPGSYEIGLYRGNDATSCCNPVFTVDCGQGQEVIVPKFEAGAINVGPAVYDVCGYVVDTNGNPIPDAIVELWDFFPDGLIEDTDTTDVTGYFGFSDVGLAQFDLWAYHEGYYPRLVEDVAFGETGIMIELTPVEPVYPTNEWVDFYCDDNTFMGEPLPVGSVVDAYDPDGVHCGTFFVTEAGSYGFMPVYGDDPHPPHETTDEGAEPGDVIRFFVNSVEAVATGNAIWTEHGDSWEVCLEAGMIVTKTCDLVEGWNLVSWNVDHESGYILDALASIEGCIELVLGFEQGGLTYDPDLPMFSTLWYVDHLSGYWIKTSCDVTLEITGTPVPATTPITVTTGWNLVSYLPDFTLATEDALASIHDDLIVALGYDGEALTYIPGEEPYNTLTEMGSCFGYWVKVTQDGDLVYPATGPVIAASQKSDNPVMSAAVPGVTATNRWINVYAHDLTLDGETVPAGATIAAHTLDGARIGGFAVSQDGLFGFMPVYADDGDTPEAEGVRPGERFYLSVDGVATNETFVWTKAGDKMEIGALTAKAGSEPALPDGYSLHQNYPNPFNPTTNIGFTLPVCSKARIDIFNILGKLVATPFDGTARAGVNEVVWDGRNFAGETVATGIYFYRLTADNYVETKKMTLMK